MSDYMMDTYPQIRRNVEEDALKARDQFVRDFAHSPTLFAENIRRMSSKDLRIMRDKLENVVRILQRSANSGN